VTAFYTVTLSFNAYSSEENNSLFEMT